MIAAASIHISIGEVAASLVLVAVAAAVSLWRRADLERDLGVAVLRSALQLTAVGYVIQAIFDSDSLWLVALLLAVPLWRARKHPRPFQVVAEHLGQGAGAIRELAHLSLRVLR